MFIPVDLEVALRKLTIRFFIQLVSLEMGNDV